MPDVTDPKAEEQVAESPEQVEEQQVAETPEPTEQAPETPQQPAEPAGPSAAELQAQLAERDAEIARLKAEPAQTPPPAAPKPPADGLRNINIVVGQVIPAARKAFIDPNTTIEKQFDTIIETTDRMLGSVLEDRVMEPLRNVAIANIQIANELAIRDLRAEDAQFTKNFEPKVKEELAKLDWNERSKPDAVQRVYHRLLGESNGKKPAAPAPATKPAASAAVLRDVAAGGGSSAPKTNGVRLTKEQEADRQEMIAEGSSSLSPENYLARLKARQDKMKGAGRKVPSTLRELV